MKVFYSYIPLKGIDSEETFFDCLCIKLSSTILRKKSYGYKVGIYSTKEFILLLKQLGIELDFYETIDKNVQSLANEKLFFLSKLYSNSIQTEPFLQLDYDTIIFEDFNYFDLNNSKLIFGHDLSLDYKQTLPHHFIDFKNNYLELYLFIRNNFSKYNFIKNCKPLMAFHTNVVGGNEYEILSKSYYDLFSFIKNNKKILLNFSLKSLIGLERQFIVGAIEENGGQINYDVNFCSHNFIKNITFDTDTQQHRVSIRNKLYQFEAADINKAAPKQTMELIDYNFEGYIHLEELRYLDFIKHIIYQKIKILDSDFIEKLEKKFGKKYSFQKNIYQTLL